MEEQNCSICDKKIGMVSGKFLLTNENNEDIISCSKCYDSLPKEEKIKLEPTMRKTGGFFNDGYAFGLAGSVGYASSQNESIMIPIKQYNLALDDIDKYSIMFFNRHFLLCDNSLKAAAMTKYGEELKKNKLDEIAKKQFFNEYDKLNRSDQKAVKKEWKQFIKENMKKNKHIKNLKVFLEIK
jgi:hypothetical protein